MKHCFRFFGKILKNDTKYSEWMIEGEENHQIKTILRLKEGDDVEVFDGNGSFALTKITQINKQHSLVRGHLVQTQSAPEGSFALCLAALKKNTMEDLIPCLVEIGLDEIHLFKQEKTPSFLFSEKTKERYDKIILSACKQSKRNFLPKLTFWNSAEEFLKNSSDRFQIKFLLDPEGERDFSKKIDSEKNILLFCGSESGLSEKEIIFFKESGAKVFSLGPNTLRAFTASISATSLIQFLRS